MLFFFNDETPVEWVIGQIDSRKANRVFGAFIEDQAICHFKFVNGVRGLVITGYEASIGAAIRLMGSEGTLEIGWDSSMTVRGKGDAEPRKVTLSEGIHGDVAIDRAAADLIHALDTPGYHPLLSVDNALLTTEIIYATYQFEPASRTRGSPAVRRKTPP